MRKYLFLLFALTLPACQAHNAGYVAANQTPKYIPNYELFYVRPQIDRVMVIKSKNEMYLMRGNRVMKSYHVALGKNPVGHKVQEGDSRTPEGRYYLDYKNNNSKFYRSMKISYPNKYDVVQAQLRGVSPGGDIVIHGYPNELGRNYTGAMPLNWTEGCIAVKNREMDEIWDLVAIDTPIDIYP